MEKQVAPICQNRLFLDVSQEVDYLTEHGEYRDYVCVHTIKNFMRNSIGGWMLLLSTDEPTEIKKNLDILTADYNQIVQIAESIKYNRRRVNKEQFKIALNEITDEGA
ncbi:hypothetical protein JCM9140_3107 [Halalkalibacter wakoensis JCM 9140]|uniref:Uncharacterized protein n=1 Tax=Halalkalibacter wakoensis JCM 9140 TaxID=1236970 RepID=W4Q4T3_9BACI|nr:hypothetical protein [Halalkalibacter wakoensis]GAE26997.1 hypothetical protein JCM9140_3107 [Halalkalibacter wakoensis JCM 9140]